MAGLDEAAVICDGDTGLTGRTLCIASLSIENAGLWSTPKLQEAKDIYHNKSLPLKWVMPAHCYMSSNETLAVPLCRWLSHCYSGRCYSHHPICFHPKPPTLRARRAVLTLQHTTSLATYRYKFVFSELFSLQQKMCQQQNKSTFLATRPGSPWGTNAVVTVDFIHAGRAKWTGWWLALINVYKK